jgi:hypothetical protein
MTGPHRELDVRNASGNHAGTSHPLPEMSDATIDATIAAQEKARGIPWPE